MNRRNFVKYSGAALGTAAISGTALLESACNSVTALADVEKFEPVVLNVLNLVCVISPANALCSTGLAMIQNDYNTVIKLWSDYNAAVAAGTNSSTLWNDLNAAFTVFEEDASQIFSLGLGLNAPEVSAIVASAQLLLAAIETLFPSAPKGATAARPSKFKAYAVGRSNYDVKWLEDWEKTYNGKVDVAQKAYPKAHLKKVHLHNWVLRGVTFGAAK